MNIFNNCIIRWKLFKLEIAWSLQRYLDFILFLVIIVTLILDIVNLCHYIVDHMAIFNSGDSGLYMSSSTGTGTGSGTGSGTGTGTGSNLHGNSEIPNGPTGPGGNPGGLPGGY